MDAKILGLIGGVLVLLGAATAVCFVLKRRTESGLDPAIIGTFWIRIRAWWLLFAGVAGAYLLGLNATVVLFGLIAFWALREFITLTPTRPTDHRTLFWVFFLCTPLQFFFVAMAWYGMYSIVIPVYAFLLIPAGIAMSGDSKRFLERTAKIQAGLLICVYCLSHAPALLTLDLSTRNDAPARETAGQEPGATTPQETQSEPGQAERAPADDARPVEKPATKGTTAHFQLLFFFVLMVQLSDVFQYAWAQLPSKHVIVPTISPGKTWEGLLGATASVTLLGTALWFVTPFPHWWHAACTSLVAALMGFAGRLTMSAIKRDRGVKDYGTLVEGHGGVLDHIDSICFAAPVFFHLARLFFATAA